MFTIVNSPIETDGSAECKDWSPEEQVDLEIISWLSDYVILEPQNSGAVGRDGKEFSFMNRNPY